MKAPSAKRIGAALAMVSLACAACILGMPRQADAATLHRGGFDDVPPDTVSIDYPLEVADAQLSATNSAYKIKSGTSWEGKANMVVYDRAVSGNQTLPGSFTLTWRDSGIDDDGDAIDLSITVSNIRTSGDADSACILSDGLNLCMDAISHERTALGAKMDVTVKATKHGKSKAASGTMLVAFVDIDMVKGPGLYSEQVELLSGFGPDVWVPSTNFLDISADATRFTSTQADDDTYDSGFVTTGDPGGFKLRWQGESCGTYLLMPFRANEQAITASAGSGGSISDPGKHFVRWKNDKTYTITPQEHYRIKDVVVDGKSIGAKAEYTFKRVTENHTIRATFERIPAHTVEFVDGFGGSISVQKVEDGDAAKAPSDPKRDGWTFTGWDKDFSHVTDDMTITAQWEPLIAVKVPTLVPCMIEADGSVTAPGGYAIENLSPVAVSLTGATTQNMPSYGSYSLADSSGNVIHSYDGGKDDRGAGLTIGKHAKAPLTWSVGDITGDQAQELLLKAIQGPTHLCNVTFTFKEA